MPWPESPHRDPKHNFADSFDKQIHQNGMWQAYWHDMCMNIVMWQLRRLRWYELLGWHDNHACQASVIEKCRSSTTTNVGTSSPSSSSTGCWTSASSAVTGGIALFRIQICTSYTIQNSDLHYVQWILSNRQWPGSLCCVQTVSTNTSSHTFHRTLEIIPRSIGAFL